MLHRAQNIFILLKVAIPDARFFGSIAQPGSDSTPYG